MRRAIPLNCKDNAGTGFVVVRDGQHYLTTCLHILTGKKENRISDLNFQDYPIRLVGSEHSFPFLQLDRQRANIAEERASDVLVDAVALHLTAEEAELLSGYGAYDYTSICDVEVGDHVIMSGYLGLQNVMIAESVRFAQLRAKSEHRLALTEPSALGMSGGPVTSTTGGLVGMVYGDQGVTKQSFYSATAISFYIAGSEIFRPQLT